MPKIIDGDNSFDSGMISAMDPIKIPKGSYAWGVNVVNSGGLVQTRPGYEWCDTLPCGKLQGFYFFQISRGRPVAVVFVEGQGYSAQYPYRDFQPIPGIRMSALADSVYCEQTTKVTERNPDNSIKLISPRRILMVQDGLSPAAYYDGTSLKYAPGVPQGTWMKWSGSRLWVARRGEIYPGDIGDPLTFLEMTVNNLGGTQKYIVDQDVTGMADVPGTADPALLVFTANTTTAFQSNLRDRASWSTTANFQRTVFPTIGCVSGRSIAPQSGQLWWFSQAGVTRMDSAALSFTTARTDLMDSEMARSKAYLGDLSNVAAVSHQDMFLVSVPFADSYNPHTWVLNTAAIDLLNQEAAPGWCSIWTGVRPVQWAVAGESRSASLYVASKDSDGKNRIYQAFSQSQRDNGCDFPCAVELRAMTGGDLSPKRIRHGHYELAELAGETNLRVLWAGASRGRWKVLGDARIFSNLDAVVNDPQTVYTADQQVVFLRKQSRQQLTEDPSEDPEDEQTSGLVESLDVEKKDRAFSIRIEWTGRAALRFYRQFMDPDQEDVNGNCETDTSPDLFVRYDGASAETLEGVAQVLDPALASTKTVTVRYHNFSTTATASVSSQISQEDADKRATQVASARANYQLRQIAPAYVGSSKI